ncbi:MAG TPA: phosphoribosylamine--glycine ligase [Poseidonia sp.]|nr:phosphoribosylamine--glycine ligase [Poseidonia sp.]
MDEATVVVIGSGGREHALCLALSSSPKVGTIHCIPGNAGTALLAQNHNLVDSSNEGIIAFATSVSASLMVVGPEAPLCDGLADLCSDSGLPCFGPVAALAHLEGSKLHAKLTMKSAGVPTANFVELNSKSDIEAALNLYGSSPWVIKRNVLAGGKGVVVTSDRDEARSFISSSIMTDGMVLLEEFLPGEEASMLVVMDGQSFVTLPASQDHKRAYDGDEGPNTGGMGAYCPAPVVTPVVHDRILERIVAPMHSHLSKQSIPYRGVLFVGLMIDEHDDPYVVEFNVRFGDPECQVTLPLISSDVFDLLHGAATDTLEPSSVKFSKTSALTVVLASEGYPSNPIKGRTIQGITVDKGDKNPTNSWINFAGVKEGEEGLMIASGGRVLSCTAIAESLEDARESAYQLLNQIKLEGGHFRTDIGFRAFSGE